MLFSSTLFLFIFLPAVLLVYFGILRKTSTRNYFLLAASLLFYAWGEPIYVFLMLFSIFCNYSFGLIIDKTVRSGFKQLWLTAAVILNLGILFYFKYSRFFISNLNVFLELQLELPDVVLPIGISFFTFQAMSYVIDVYRKTTQVQKNPLYLALYVSFFPQLIAGPIVRYSTIEQQIQHRTVTLDGFESGVCRFIQGFGKKVLLSNVMSLTAEHVFSLAVQQQLSVSLAWLGALAYTFQIYFDFSGYSDMAIGMGHMFGFRFDENFRHPYLSRSVSEFWNRWHISLGQWFRDYVYFPLGGSRVSKMKLLRNLFAVWLLTGIWHGAAWQFIFWGLGYGILISLEKLTNFPKRLKSRPAITAYGIFTFLTVVVGWVFFGSQGLQSALYQLSTMFGLNSAVFWEPFATYTLREYGVYFILAAIFSTPLPSRLTQHLKRNLIFHIAKTIMYMAVLILSVSFLAMGVHNPFIYFNF